MKKKSTPRPLVSIIITHYKAHKELLACIASMKQFKPKTSYEIIVVDNDQENPVKTELLDQFPLVRYVKAPYNLGFGPGNNYGVKSARGDIYFFLNADTQFQSNVIDALAAFFRIS